ncbi:MAG: NAD(P)-binding protein [Lachnospiraceae bacterium]|nr:NAD(P)-binding protein [Lachnospiraceae bacterium]
MKKILIVGAGLSGLTAAYQLAQNFEAQIIIIEKGKHYAERVVEDESGMVCGEGGAGTIYGGKLCFPPASAGVWKRTGFYADEFAVFCERYLKFFIQNKKFPESGGISMILSKTDNFFQKNYESILLTKTEMNCFVSSLLAEVRKYGVDIITSCEFIDYKKVNDGYIIQCKKNNTETIEELVDYIIFASGRLSSERIMKWFGKQKNVRLQNPDLGIRFGIDYNRTEIFREIGKDIKLKAQIGDIGLRTFCVCSGGSKTIVNLNGMKYYDGHFENVITKQVNLGILARSPYIYGFEGAALYCSYLKEYINLDWSLKDFVKNGDSLIKETNLFVEVFEAIIHFIRMMQKEQILEENLDKYPVWLPSVDRLNPIVSTDEHFETNCKNIYVIGDAVGISRGFVQSMWSGYCAGNRISEELKGIVQKEKKRA